jgi:hypothetical protein
MKHTVIKKRNYIVVKCDSKEELEKTVNKHINEDNGLLLGGVCLHGNENTYFYQAMTIMVEVTDEKEIAKIINNNGFI